MRVREFIVELADRPAQFEWACRTPDVCVAESPELNLTLYINRGISREKKDNAIFIDFTVNDEHKLTGKGNAIQILSTVLAMMSAILPKFIKRTDDFVTFAAEKSEHSRVSLYSRAVPKITSILKTIDYAWKYYPTYEPNSGLQKYTWEREMG
jgi:hypothetical protein